MATGSDGDRAGAPRSLKRLAKLLVLGLVVNYLVLPQFAGARRALEIVSDVDLRLLGLGLLLQLGALAFHSQLTRSLVPAGSRPPFHVMYRIEIADMAASHVIPAGTAAGTALGFQLLRERGVRGTDAGFAMAMQGIGSALVLHALLWTALIASIPRRGFHPLYTAAAGAGVVLVAIFVALVLLLSRGEERSRRVVSAVGRRVPFVDPEGAGRVVERAAERLSDLTRRKGTVARAAGWALVYRLLDAGSLWVFLAGFGVGVPVDVLVIAYGVAFALATIPVSPGGLGVVEAAATTVLVAFGIPRGEAILGVIGYRLANFWLPIPLGAASYLTLKVERDEIRERWKDELGDAWDQIGGTAERFRDWAARNGLLSDRSGDG